MSESFAVSILTSIPKQPVPSLPLVHSKLDYCNSLYYNLPKSQINRLQQIQNCLARTVVKAPRSSHITPILRSLHWLKINECIEYKLLSLTYKFLTTSQPDYLSMFSPPQGGHVRPPVVVWHFVIVPGRRLPSCHRWVAAAFHSEPNMRHDADKEHLWRQSILDCWTRTERRWLIIQ